LSPTRRTLHLTRCLRFAAVPLVLTDAFLRPLLHLAAINQAPPHRQTYRLLLRLRSSFLLAKLYCLFVA
jgi:hypothetical protein